MPSGTALDFRSLTVSSARPRYTIDVLLSALHHLSLTAVPRTTFQYSKLIMLLSHAIESLSSMPPGAYLIRRVWTPLRMQATYVSLPDAQAAVARDGAVLAQGYFWNMTSLS